MKKIMFSIIAIIVLTMPTNAISLYEVAMSCPGVSNAIVKFDDYHIGVTIAPSVSATPSDLAYAIRSLLIFYAVVLEKFPDYNGYLRIGIYNSKTQNMAIYEASAIDTRIADEAGYLDIDFITETIENGKMVHYYLSDQWGDVTKNVWIGGSSASPSVGNWL